MSPQAIYFWNGEWKTMQDVSVNPFSQTLHYGFGVYEGIRAYRTVHGIKIFKAQEHFKRLLHSGKTMGMPLRYDVDMLTQIAYSLLEKNKLKDAYIRPLLVGDANMKLTFPEKSYLFMGAWKWGKLLGSELLHVCLSSFRKPTLLAAQTESKICGNYAFFILASHDAKQRGFDEALLLDDDGWVAQGTGTNFFMEKEGKLYTPSLGKILPGITRQTVMDICREMDIEVVEKKIHPEELFESDGAFFCGTAAEIAGIQSIDHYTFKKKWRDTAGAVIQSAYKCMTLEKGFQEMIV